MPPPPPMSVTRRYNALSRDMRILFSGMVVPITWPPLITEDLTLSLRVLCFSDANAKSLSTKPLFCGPHSLLSGSSAMNGSDGRRGQSQDQRWIVLTWLIYVLGSSSSPVSLCVRGGRPSAVPIHCCAHENVTKRQLLQQPESPSRTKEKSYNPDAQWPEDKP